MRSRLRLQIQPQPDETTCGPTSLHAVYRYFGDEIPLERVVAESQTLESGGTLAVLLALHALRRGYRAAIHTYNLQLFDPTWFRRKGIDLRLRLEAQARAKDDLKLHIATRAYLEFLRLGGEILFEDLTPELLQRHLGAGIPILTGLSATYLYRTARERGWDSRYDSIRGHPSGHFVVLAGYDPAGEVVYVADPLHSFAVDEGGHAPVDARRLINAILLGVLTYDGNLLVLAPPDSRRGSRWKR